MEGDADARSEGLVVAQFLQVFLEAQKVLFVCQDIESECLSSIISLLDRQDRVEFELKVNSLVLHHFRLSTLYLVFHDRDLEDWVKARSTTWYSLFLMKQFENARWIKHFRVTREVVEQLTKKLPMLMKKKDTRYRFVIPMGIRVACALYKLAHGADYLQCLEMFAVGKSTIHMVLHEFVSAVIETFRGQLAWPEGEDLRQVMLGFLDFCGLPSVHGAIDASQIHIVRPKGLFATDYYSYKSKAYNIQLQAVVDHRKCFREVFVGMPGSVSDARVLRLSILYKKALFEGLLESHRGCQDGIQPYLIGDKGYPLRPWLMIPHKLGPAVRLSILEAAFNKHLSRGRSVVENAFGILKKTFKELLLKSTLDVSFLPDVVYCCCILHNMILNGKDVDIDTLLAQLEREDHGFPEEVAQEAIEDCDDGGVEVGVDLADEVLGAEQSGYFVGKMEQTQILSLS